jgi:dihydroorotate dehydrogenase
MCARAFEAGWAGACFKTICTLDIHEASPRFSALYSDGGSIMGFKNVEQLSDHSVAENMAVFRRLKAEYPKKFIMASIMGQDEAEWRTLAHLCQENGADAVELNFSCPNMAEGGMGSDIGQVPELVERFTAAAKSDCSIPVLAKLTPNVANMSPAAEAALRGGADGIAAINTIKSVLGVNVNTYVFAPAVHGNSAVGGYSGNAVKPIALRFIAELGYTLVALWSSAEIAASVNLDKHRHRGYRNMILTGMWGLAQLVLLVVPTLTVAGNGALPKVLLLYVLVVYLFNSWCFYGCFSAICPQGEEFGKPSKPSRFRFMNEINRKLDEKNERARLAYEQSLQEKNRKFSAKNNNRQHKKKK